MKIAILTQPLRSNYGGIMQAYALQKVLSDFGHDVVTIDRQYDRKKRIARLRDLLKPIIHVITGRVARRRLSHREQEYVSSNIKLFIERHVARSECINTEAQLAAHFESIYYDKVVVGSDQVWRPCYSPNIYNYFVDFLETELPVISYAASFGVDHWEYSERQTQKCRSLVAKFAAISVREESAVSLCKDNLGVKAVVVLDPTLLLSRENYESLLEVQDTPGRGKGVFLYILDPTAEKNEIVSSVSSSLGLETFECGPQHLVDTRSRYQPDKYPSVERWIGSFRDADFVVTDSFHGCVFSLIFRKPFVVVANHDRGAARFNSLLKLFNLTSRLVDIDTNLNNVIIEDINWGDVELRWAELREHSLRYIADNI
ncbi:polysaccharide pyruvyl transferase family protein [Pseudomonas profundi]|uniref:polysaccharide pyruvyl transferase family protein n=1 Tax=Pseudomonas profundi TaxID=1981513 RepID=UPI00123A92C1|nr:polysaccharide pyruvyl transferase family protein [Pseudomonas profundi]